MRILSFEDGKIMKEKMDKTILVGIKINNTFIEDIFYKEIEIDGLNATEKVIEIVNEAKPIDLILLSGISYAGFNLIDSERIYEEFKIPLVIYTKKKPNNMDVLSALIKHFPDWRRRWNIIKRTLKASRGIHQIKLRENEKPVYIETIGISVDEATRILRENTIWGRTPEPIRIAEIIAKETSKTYIQIKQRKG
ncbi:MAG: DUF99 family protein [Candidatus Methanomethylicia archaeon]|nr:DUF99 family protein [Candidatus Methanomethylicia archaeon]